jgi:hypothetical protein
MATWIFPTVIPYEVSSIQGRGTSFDMFNFVYDRCKVEIFFDITFLPFIAQ